MNLVSITSKQQKITPEEKHLNRMSKLPFMNTLLERVSHIKNTDAEFEGKYINICTDIGKLSQRLLSFQYTTELNSLKKESNSTKETGKNTREELNKRVTKWYFQEKITTPAAIIFREIDQICAEKKIILSTTEKEEILDIVNEKYTKLDTLNKDASVISILSPLKSYMDEKINVQEIKKNLITDMKKEVPEQFRILVDTFHKNKTVPQKEELMTPVESLIFNDIPVVREIAGKMVSDVYSGLIEEIYNILFRDKSKEQPLDFNAIKMEARMQAERIVQDKKPSQRNEINPEDIIRRKFESKVTLTTSSPEKKT
ncbi:hypothetical protein [Morganella morganii]|uniref:hypothetical protein n=1 Tax=Morganella morganii TaxID=582 RepID=UPI001BD98CD9|nr:hypothetical protein [Morganella morganii]MBT0419386.1 hypothetical protein [Morganella morganii subsp. morganii]MBT0514182.1 hypothetical protein [Morganella morganii subsp. morganii]QWM04731.1 hypothetical protein IZ185_03030 [Morganella morganii subsp. morganii]